MQEYLDKVIAIAKFKYELEEEIILSFTPTIEQCYGYNFTPIRTVEVIASNIFG